MANFTTAFKAEVARIARRAMGGEIATLRKLVAQHRRTIAALRREVTATARTSKLSQRVASAAAVASKPDAGKVRFQAKGLISLRKRLGISAEDMGRLLDVTGQSVRNWEAGTSAPKADTLAKLAQVRAMGKRTVAAQLESSRVTGLRAGGRKAKPVKRRKAA